METVADVVAASEEVAEVLVAVVESVAVVVVAVATNVVVVVVVVVVDLSGFEGGDLVLYLPRNHHQTEMAVVDIVVDIVAEIVDVADSVVVVVVESQTGRSWEWLCSEGGRYTRVGQE